MPVPPQRLSLQQWQLGRESVRAHGCVSFWVCAACNDVLAWSEKQEQSADVFEELGGIRRRRRRRRRKKKCLFMGCGPVQGDGCLGWNNVCMESKCRGEIGINRSRNRMQYLDLRSDLLYTSPVFYQLASCIALRIAVRTCRGGGSASRKREKKRIEQVGGRPGRGGGSDRSRIAPGRRKGGERRARI